MYVCVCVCVCVQLLARVFTTFFPIQMDRNPIATELTATKQLEDKAKKRD